jgi:hypothetical protein
MRRLLIHKMCTPVSCNFSRPLLIYDDKCSSCRKFATYAKILSRGWIRIAGHYYSLEAINAKKAIFPIDYDSTQMFWLIDNRGAYGARYGLRQVLKEIVRGIIKAKIIHNMEDNQTDSGPIDTDDYSMQDNKCNSRESAGSTCSSIRNTSIRILNMLRNSSRFYHPEYK